jgi:hypothetical protein
MNKEEQLGQEFQHVAASRYCSKRTCGTGPHLGWAGDMDRWIGAPWREQLVDRATEQDTKLGMTAL